MNKLICRGTNILINLPFLIMLARLNHSGPDMAHGRHFIFSLGLAAVLGVVCSGCAWWSPESAYSLRPVLEHSLTGSTAEFQQIGGKPYTYRRIDTSGKKKDYSAFFTAVQECKDRMDSSKFATTRQLLVGLTDLQILAQQSVMFQREPSLFTLVSAKLETRPIILAIYSARTLDCINDFIVWFTSKAGKLPEEETVQAELADIKPFLEKNFPLKGASASAEKTD